MPAPHAITPEKLSRLVGTAHCPRILDLRNAPERIIPGAVTGVQKRYLNAFPMLITGYYYFSTAWRDPKIYLGGGIGAYYMLQNFDLGVNRLEASNWHFGAAPEVGLQFPAGNSQGIVNVKYNWVNESGEGIAGQERGYAYWGLNAGFAWDF